jgi:hypothetical protein
MQTSPLCGSATHAYFLATLLVNRGGTTVQVARRLDNKRTH